MEGIVSSNLLASATASVTGASAGLDAKAFKTAVDNNLELLDLKMAFKTWESTFDSNTKATELAHNLCKVTHYDEYVSLSKARLSSARTCGRGCRSDSSRYCHRSGKTGTPLPRRV